MHRLGVPGRGGFLTLLIWLSSAWSVATYAQEFDGLVDDPQSVLGKPILVQPIRGALIEGELAALQPSRASENDVQFVEVVSNGRSRKIKGSLIATLQIDGRPMALQPYYPTGTLLLIDVDQAHAAADARLASLGRQRNATFPQAEFDRLTVSSLSFARQAMQQFGAAAGIGVEEGSHVILLTDYPPQQRQKLLRVLDQFIPKLNVIFGFDDEDLVLPGKPIVGAFGIRENLGKFQADVVGNKSYGKIRAFFHIVEEHVVVSAEDDRSPQHMIWQAAWGLSGAYAFYGYSNVELPAWIRVGLQQHCADVLVPSLTNRNLERTEVLEELKSGALNGILNAENLPGQRQLVCKLLAAHLYRLNPGAFGQLLSLLKLGRDTDEAVMIAFGLSQEQLAGSFGRALGIPLLQP
jgi:hypothetical protein